MYINMSAIVFAKFSQDWLCSVLENFNVILITQLEKQNIEPTNKRGGKWQ